jgi:phosphoribosylformylglycinamidine cyclo-ligase
VKPALSALASGKFGIKGFAHITGSGFYNIPRINGKFRYRITDRGSVPEIFHTLQERAGLELKEMYATFNMGVGFVIACRKGKAKALTSFLRKKGERAWVLGQVEKGKGEVVVETEGQPFTLA